MNSYHLHQSPRNLLGYELLGHLQDLLNQKVWEMGSSCSFFRNPPGGSDAYSSQRTTELDQEWEWAQEAQTRIQREPHESCWSRNEVLATVMEMLGTVKCKQGFHIARQSACSECLGIGCTVLWVAGYDKIAMARELEKDQEDGIRCWEE